jgi:hypothetical protein
MESTYSYQCCWYHSVNIINFPPKNQILAETYYINYIKSLKCSIRHRNGIIYF